MHFSASSLLSALAIVPAALAHTAFTNFYVNGVDQGDGICMRMFQNGEKSTYPIEDLSSNDMVCGFKNASGPGVPRVCPLKDQSTITFEFRANPEDASKGSLDESHKGPCAVYIKKVDSALSDSGEGDGWFKIWDQGYDFSSSQWCTERLIKEEGRLSVEIPKDLQGGYYLIRPELLALHAAAPPDNDPQFFIGCAQVFIESSGDLVPESTVPIPGHVTAGEPAVSFDIYYPSPPDYASYPNPGPAVAKLVSGGQTAATTGDTPTEGLEPAGCLLENCDWCGFEVPDFTDETSCWAASDDCWAQSDKCWNPYRVTGVSRCAVWDAKCQAIMDACDAGNYQGPSDKGKVLTPEKTTVAVSLVSTTIGTAGSGSAATKAATKAKKDAAAAAEVADSAETPSDSVTTVVVDKTVIVAWPPMSTSVVSSSPSVSFTTVIVTATTVVSWP